MRQLSDTNKNIVQNAAWFGLLTGLFEGLFLFSFVRLRLLNGQLSPLGIKAEILWISIVFNLVLFIIIGFGFLLIKSIFPRLSIIRVADITFILLFILNILLIFLGGRVSIEAILILALGISINLARVLNINRVSFMQFNSKSLPILTTLSFIIVVGVKAGYYVREQTQLARLPEPAPSSPNVLVLVLDALRADHLSSYGYERNTSPNIDNLAKNGILFENAFSTCSWTRPAHASLLTGRLTSEHGADWWHPMNNQFDTIAEALNNTGYRTAAISANVNVFNSFWGFDRGFIRFEDQYWSLENDVFNTVYGKVTEYYILHKIFGMEHKLDRKLASDVNKSILDWIDHDNTQPFFIFVNYFDIHDPYYPPEPYNSHFSETNQSAGFINTTFGFKSYSINLSPEQLQAEIDAYDGSILYVDAQIGYLLEELHTRDLLENTIIIITSDHGEHFGEHGLTSHGNSLYIESIQVPLIYWWSDYIPAGKRIDTPVSIANIPSTLVDLVGINNQYSFPGQSLREAWLGYELKNGIYPVSELEHVEGAPENNLNKYGYLRSVISPELHYIFHEKFGEELYNWKTDSPETNNLASFPENTKIMNEFRQYLNNRTK